MPETMKNQGSGEPLTRTNDEVVFNHPINNHTPDLSEVLSSVLISELWKRFKTRITGGKTSSAVTDWKPPDRTFYEPPPQVQVIHKYIIPETPVGLVGDRVVYNQKYLKSVNITVMPECGYFTITKAVLRDDGRVFVALHPNSNSHRTDDDGTHICLSEMRKYSPYDDAGKAKLKDFIETMEKHMGCKLLWTLRDLHKSYGIRCLDDVSERTLMSFRGVGKGTYAEFLRVKEKYFEISHKKVLD